MPGEGRDADSNARALLEKARARYYYHPHQRKTVSMACRPCSAAGNRTEKSYTHTMTGKGLSPRERKRERVTGGDCGQEMAAGSLDLHRMSQHGRARERKWTWTDATTGGEEPRTYRIDFPKGGAKTCPVEGCPGRAGTRTAMRVHFWRRHVRYILLSSSRRETFLTLAVRTVD